MDFNTGPNLKTTEMEMKILFAFQTLHSAYHDLDQKMHVNKVQLTPEEKKKLHALWVLAQDFVELVDPEFFD